MGGSSSKGKSEKEVKVLTSLVQIQKAYSSRREEIWRDYNGKVVFAQVILKSDKLALLFNKNCGLVFMGEPNHCALDDVVLAVVDAHEAIDLDVKFGKTFLLNPSKLVLFTASAISSGPSWTTISNPKDTAALWLSSDEHHFEKFVESCLHGYGVKCLNIMTDKLANIIDMNCNATYNKLLAIFSESFDYLIWKDAGCAMVIYSTEKGAILVDDKNGLIVCLYKEVFSDESATPLSNGQTLYDVSFNYVHFRFVRLLPVGNVAAMFEVKSLLICNENTGEFEKRVDCLPVTNANLAAFLGHLDPDRLVEPDTFIDAACKHLVRKDNLYHDGFVPTFRKRFREIMEQMKEEQRMLNQNEEVPESLPNNGGEFNEEIGNDVNVASVEEIEQSEGGIASEIVDAVLEPGIIEAMTEELDQVIESALDDSE